MGSPKTYLFVHGASYGGWAWKKVVPLLHAQGHRVQAIDLPGHGDDNTSPEKVTLEDYMNKVIDVANAQPGSVILVGHSSGGVTIAQAAERLGVVKVEKLIFLDASCQKMGNQFSLWPQNFNHLRMPENLILLIVLYSTRGSYFYFGYRYGCPLSLPRLFCNGYFFCKSKS